MNSEDFQNSNLLAESLQKNGIDCSTTEALDKANDIIQVTEAKVPEENEFRSLERRYKYLLEQNNGVILNEIDSLKKSMNSLIAELNLVKSQIQQQGEKLKLQTYPEKKETQKKIEEKKADKTNFHPKQGNYNPEDVSIEKIFYFGKK